MGQRLYSWCRTTENTGAPITLVLDYKVCSSILEEESQQNLQTPAPSPPHIQLLKWSCSSERSMPFSPPSSRALAHKILPGEEGETSHKSAVLSLPELASFSTEHESSSLNLSWISRQWQLWVKGNREICRFNEDIRLNSSLESLQDNIR